MSEADWYAALVDRAHATIWPIRDSAACGPAFGFAVADLAQLAGPVIAAGLDGVPRAIPAKPLGATVHVPGLPQVAAIPMLSQESPAALSQGAETAIAGYLTDHPSFDGVVLVLGPQSCWAHISAEEVVSFQSFLTPELSGALGADTPAQDSAFDQALSDTLSRPDRLAQHLASARASGSRQERAHLIGAEISAAKPYWLGQNVVILGDETAAAPYLRALEMQGLRPERADLEAALLKGFARAWDQAVGETA